MSTTNEPGVESTAAIRETLETIFRHKGLVLVFALAVVASTLLMVASAPDSYASASKIMIRRGRESSMLDPTATTGEVAPLYKEWETEVNSEVEILSSYELAVQTATEMGPERILHPPFVKPQGWLAPVKTGLHAARTSLGGIATTLRHWLPGEARKDGAGTLLDKAARIIQKSLEVSSQRKSDVITITYSAPQPELAREVVEVLLKRYQEKRLQIRSKPDSRRFFQEQTLAIQREWMDTESDLRRRKDELGVVSLEGRRNSLVERLNTLQNQKLHAAAELSASQAKVEKLREMVAQEAGASGSRSALVRGDYKEIQTAQRIEETTMASLAAQAAMLDRQLSETQDEIQRLNAREAEFLDLQRKAELLEAKYRKYADSLEQTRIDQALEAEKISNVSIIQHATLPTEPHPARKLVKLVLAAFLGLFGGIGLALAADRLGSTVRRPDEAERRLHLTPLATIPLLKGKGLHPLLKEPSSKDEEDGLLRRMRNGLDTWTVDSHFTRLLRRILAVRALHNTTPLVLGVTSCYGREGVTSVAAQLAVSFARLSPQAKVLFLDANSQPHSEEQQDWLAPARGGLAVLHDPDGGIHFQPAHLEGKAADNGQASTALERISRDRITPLLRRAAAQGFDVMVVDIPPLSEGSDAEHIASRMSAVVLVIEAERVRWQTLQWAKTLLSDTGTQLLGIILNKQKFYVPGWLYRRL